MGGSIQATGWRLAALVAAALSLCACQQGGDAARYSGGGAASFHLEDHLDEATVVDSEVPSDIPESVTWRFDEAQPDWKAVPLAGTVALSRADDALRVTLGEQNQIPGQGGYIGLVSVDLPDLRRDDWAEVLIEARTDGAQFLVPGFNLGSRTHPQREEWTIPYLYKGRGTMAIRDGNVHTYRLRADWSDPSYGEWKGPWRQLLLQIWAVKPADLDLVSVSLIPKASLYADAGVGVRSVVRGQSRRKALYTHAPGGSSTTCGSRTREGWTSDSASCSPAGPSPSGCR